MELVMVFADMLCGYGRVKTLTDVSVRNYKGDISAFRHSIMVGVLVVCCYNSIRESNHGSHFNGAMYVRPGFCAARR